MAVNERVLITWGTRPELIKLFLVAKALRNIGVVVDFVCTGQHSTELAKLGFETGVETSELIGYRNLPNSLGVGAGELLIELSRLIDKHQYAFCVVQGDTTSTLMGALASFFSGVKIAHVEAGLRTGNLRQPFPEEGNRRLISSIADLHFTPTNSATKNLIGEGIEAETIFEVGNTVVDALHWVNRFVVPIAPATVPWTAISSFLQHRFSSVAVVTAHRRESWQEMESIAEVIHSWALVNPHFGLVLPLHPNRLIRSAFARFASLDNALLVEPLPYVDMVRLLGQVNAVISDSGGLVEEATSLGIPTVILREVTERQEAVSLGLARLVGVDAAGIENGLRWLESVLSDPVHQGSPNKVFGDGNAAVRIAEVLADVMRHG